MRKVKQIVKQNTNQATITKTRTMNLASKSGVPGAIRTLDPLLRRQLLCPPELQGQKLNHHNLARAEIGGQPSSS